MDLDKVAMSSLVAAAHTGRAQLPAGRPDGFDLLAGLKQTREDIARAAEYDRSLQASLERAQRDMEHAKFAAWYRRHVVRVWAMTERSLRDTLSAVWCSWRVLVHRRQVLRPMDVFLCQSHVLIRCWFRWSLETRLTKGLAHLARKQTELDETIVQGRNEVERFREALDDVIADSVSAAADMLRANIHRTALQFVMRAWIEEVQRRQNMEHLQKVVEGSLRLSRDFIFGQFLERLYKQWLEAVYDLKRRRGEHRNHKRLDVMSRQQHEQLRGYWPQQLALVWVAWRHFAVMSAEEKKSDAYMDALDARAAAEAAEIRRRLERRAAACRAIYSRPAVDLGRYFQHWRADVQQRRQKKRMGRLEAKIASHPQRMARAASATASLRVGALDLARPTMHDCFCVWHRSCLRSRLEKGPQAQRELWGLRRDIDTCLGRLAETAMHNKVEALLAPLRRAEGAAKRGALQTWKLGIGVDQNGVLRGEIEAWRHEVRRAAVAKRQWEGQLCDEHQAMLQSSGLAARVARVAIDDAGWELVHACLLAWLSAACQERAHEMYNAEETAMLVAKANVTQACVELQQSREEHITQTVAAVLSQHLALACFRNWRAETRSSGLDAHCDTAIDEERSRHQQYMAENMAMLNSLMDKAKYRGRRAMMEQAEELLEALLSWAFHTWLGIALKTDVAKFRSTMGLQFASAAMAVRLKFDSGIIVMLVRLWRCASLWQKCQAAEQELAERAVEETQRAQRHAHVRKKLCQNLAKDFHNTHVSSAFGAWRRLHQEHVVDRVAMAVQERWSAKHTATEQELRRHAEFSRRLRAYAARRMAVVRGRRSLQLMLAMWRYATCQSQRLAELEQSEVSAMEGMDVQRRFEEAAVASHLHRCLLLANGSRDARLLGRAMDGWKTFPPVAAFRRRRAHMRSRAAHFGERITQLQLRGGQQCALRAWRQAAQRSARRRMERRCRDMQRALRAPQHGRTPPPSTRRSSRRSETEHSVTAASLDSKAPPFSQLDRSDAGLRPARKAFVPSIVFDPPAAAGAGELSFESLTSPSASAASPQARTTSTSQKLSSPAGMGGGERASMSSGSDGGSGMAQALGEKFYERLRGIEVAIPRAGAEHSLEGSTRPSSTGAAQQAAPVAPPAATAQDVPLRPGREAGGGASASAASNGGAGRRLNLAQTLEAQFAERLRNIAAALPELGSASGDGGAPLPAGSAGGLAAPGVQLPTPGSDVRGRADGGPEVLSGAGSPTCSDNVPPACRVSHALEAQFADRLRRINFGLSQYAEPPREAVPGFGSTPLPKGRRA